jgi:ATP phosphoribosyltransferase regulatory subunit HisZ
MAIGRESSALGHYGVFSREIDECQLSQKWRDSIERILLDKSLIETRQGILQAFEVN